MTDSVDWSVLLPSPRGGEGKLSALGFKHAGGQEVSWGVLERGTPSTRPTEAGRWSHPETLEPSAPPGGGGCWGVRSAPDPHRIGDGLGRRDRRESAAPGLSTGSLLHLLFFGGFPSARCTRLQATPLLGERLGCLCLGGSHL